MRINDRFNAALLRHSTRGLQLAAGLKATQNLQPVPLGNGIWTKATPFTATWKLADPSSGEVATVGFFHVDGRGAYFISRLRIVDRRIAESEFFYTRRGETIFFNPDDPVSFDAALDARVPAAERSSRAELVLMADENIQASAMGGERFVPAHLKRAAGRIIGGENGYEIPASVMQQGGPPRMPGARMAGKVIMERDPEDAVAPPAPGNSAAPGGDGAESGPGAGPGGPVGPGGGGKGQVMRERRHPLVDEERGLVLSFFIMGGRPPRDGEHTDWDKYYGQPEVKDGETVTIPNRSTYRVFITKYSGGEMIANAQFEREIAPHVVSGYRDAQTRGPE
ncbi:MAG TPA: hypothetical protein VMI92_07005 [Steroidobacteraceae bacterium]|nr:hypothetical protein [Steroidobacteraceae bacterium]